MSDLANNAVSGNDKQAFSNFRKLTALGIALDPTGIAGQAAAMLADKAVFQKSVEVAVGKGIMRADEAVEAMIDRTASHAAVGIRAAAAPSHRLLPPERTFSVRPNRSPARRQRRRDTGSGPEAQRGSLRLPVNR